MKKIFLLVVLFTRVIVSCLSAQTMGSDNSKFESPNKIWLQRSDGKIMLSSGDTIFREFFTDKWIMVQSSRPLKKEEHIMCVFQPPTGTARAYGFNNNMVSDEALKHIKTDQLGTIVTFIVTEKIDNIPSPYFNAVQLILK